jgi:signal transduction histidine kinase
VRPSSSNRALASAAAPALSGADQAASAVHADVGSNGACPTTASSSPWSRAPLLGSIGSRTGGLRASGGLLVGAAVYAAVVYPRSSPGGEVAAIVGIATVVALIAVGLSVQASEGRERMGRLLVYAGVLSSPWLLVGSSNPLAFSIGRLWAGFMPILLGYLILAYPRGRLHSLASRWFLALVSVPLASSWIITVLTSAQPPFATPNLRCAPQCPSNALFVGHSAISGPFLWGVARVAWMALAVGLVIGLLGRLRGASTPVRQSVVPVLLWAAVYAVALAGFLLNEALSPAGTTSPSLRSVSVAIVPAIPLAMLLGFARETLFMGRALSSFVKSLADNHAPDLQALMSRAMQDPSLRILYRRPTFETYVDSSGAPVGRPQSNDQQAVTPIERDGQRVAVVVHDAELSDQKRFIEAAGAAGVIWFRNAQLAADLKASVSDLAASRVRLVETADAERQRIEHSLHDGAQQHLVGMRLRLDLAAEAFSKDRGGGMEMLAEIGHQMDETLDDVRSLAKGVYPPLLPEHGLGGAIRSANRRSPWPASLDVTGIGRYPADTEAAVYFCCLEALQNITKHAGSAVNSAIHLWEADRRLHFEVSDDGMGFAQERVKPGDGLTNMRDRMDTVGGRLTVISHERRGTVVHGSVPLARASAGSR